MGKTYKKKAPVTKQVTKDEYKCYNHLFKKFTTELRK